MLPADSPRCAGESRSAGELRYRKSDDSEVSLLAISASPSDSLPRPDYKGNDDCGGTDAVGCDLAPAGAVYEHEQTWHDDNGHSHVQASLLGPSLSVPVVGGKLTLGTWQQIVLVDFDTRGRTRTIICQIIGQ